jgi:glutaminyl-peptide cyclotransferase
LFLIGLATIILSIISSEHKEHVSLFKAEVQNEGFEVVKKYKLAETRFVEGLEFIDSEHLLMSSGSYGDSHLDVLNIGQEPVQTVKSTPLDS